jgi:hypothetical protein
LFQSLLRRTCTVVRDVRDRVASVTRRLPVRWCFRELIDAAEADHLKSPCPNSGIRLVTNLYGVRWQPAMFEAIGVSTLGRYRRCELRRPCRPILPKCSCRRRPPSVLAMPVTDLVLFHGRAERSSPAALPGNGGPVSPGLWPSVSSLVDCPDRFQTVFS